MSRAYVVDYKQDEDGLWVASVPGFPGCHAQGKTIEEARERIREALGLYVDDADTAELIEVSLSSTTNNS